MFTLKQVEQSVVSRWLWIEYLQVQLLEAPAPQHYAAGLGPQPAHVDQLVAPPPHRPPPQALGTSNLRLQTTQLDEPRPPDLSALPWRCDAQPQTGQRIAGLAHHPCHAWAASRHRFPGPPVRATTWVLLPLLLEIMVVALGTHPWHP